MSTVITTLSTDIFLRTLVNLTTSIISTNALYTWFLEHKNNDYQIYQHKIISIDLNNKLCVVSALIKDIIKKYHLQPDDNMDLIINEFIKNNQQVEEETTETTDFSMINYTEKFNTIIKMPEALKIALISTLEIINIINKELYKLQSKITIHKKSYSSIMYSANIENEINVIFCNSQIFEKRIKLFFQIINAYDVLNCNAI
jgi:hypothetical protein